MGGAKEMEGGAGLQRRLTSPARELTQGASMVGMVGTWVGMQRINLKGGAGGAGLQMKEGSWLGGWG